MALKTAFVTAEQFSERSVFHFRVGMLIGALIYGFVIMTKFQNFSLGLIDSFMTVFGQYSCKFSALFLK